ncbi:MAG: hypothetical protein CM15mP13_3240 [Pseudomonadota bacterium]|nr:MAG: hypothetical protein CM15mP13_3240 [Pseudomonadota bacterium]
MKIFRGICKSRKCENFDFFKPLFKKVEDELNHGFREILTLEKRPLIKKGMYFILNGLITYVAEGW